MRSPQISTREQGFTLVELLVVIGIIAILTAIAVPMFLNQQKKAYDASLRSDLKNAATAFMGAEIDYEKFTALLGTGGAAFIAGEDSDQELNPATNWNLHPNLPKIPVSKTNVIEVKIRPKVQEHVSWDPHDQYEFCMVGSSNRSHYNYVPGSGNGSYAQYLFYDMRLGGVVTMDEMIEASNKGDRLSCSGYVS